MDKPGETEKITGKAWAIVLDRRVVGENYGATDGKPLSVANNSCLRFHAGHSYQEK